MKKYISCILTGCLLTVLVSCENMLEKYPLNYPSTETFLQNEAEIQMAIVGIHSVLYISGDMVPYPLYYDTGSDIAAERDSKPEQLFQAQTAGHLNELWTNMYKGINRCNFILENIDRASDNVPGDKLTLYKAQTRVLRAYFYHWLISVFGDVPFIDHTLSLDESFVMRESKDRIIEFIFTECDEAAQYLQQTNEPNTMAMTKGFAWAVKARTALYGERWTDAVDACQKIMALEGIEYILEPDYGDITMLRGKTSKEIIWAVQYNQDDKQHLMPSRFKGRLPGGFTNKMPTQALVDSYECIDGLPIDKSPLYDPQHPWENRDPRIHKSIVLPGSVFFGYQYETNRDSLECWDYNQSPAIRIPNLEATHAYASYSGYGWRKYCDSLEYRTDGASSINAIVFRYADVLLMYAEAKIELNQIDESVYTAINKVRSRAGMPDITPGKSQQELRAAVRKERKYELAGEGLRLFDIRRWKIADRLMNGMCYGRVPDGYPATAPRIDEYGNPDYTSFPEKDKFGTKLGVRFFDPARDYLSPIPFSERQVNPNLTQNPGY
ncbi:MAG: RagB/SusD family nutrient uptake outer membrane protein [Dysgonamonadaceae bacterium]|nr:RagB/SusD family nutrient uptake outer membrane protein [Dysgonamonadaceae bacterium]